MTSSQPNTGLVRDYDRSYTLWHGDVKPVPQDLPYVISFTPDPGYTEPGLPHPYVVWCETHCTEPWAWWFDAFASYLGFTSQSELTLFKLSCL